MVLANQRGEFDYAQWRTCLSEIDQQWQGLPLGLAIAEDVELAHIGILGYVVQSCDTLAHGLQRYQDLHRLLYNDHRLIIEADHEQIRISWNLPPAETTQLTDEIALALLFQFLKKLLGLEGVQVREVHFRQPRRDDIRVYEAYFGGPVSFGQTTTCIALPYSLLMQPIRHADHTLQQLLLQQAQALLQQLPQSSRLDSQLQEAILSGLQQGQCTLAAIARQLEVSSRTLQRHLAAQHSSFEQRVMAVRRMLAEQYLQDRHLSLQDIALLLGYSEQSAFQRAFKHWTGLTPRQWRQHNSATTHRSI